MSKSTPICDLQNNSDTRPIVADILKEIQQENNSPDIDGEGDDYEKEQLRALEYQIDGNIQHDDLQDEPDDISLANSTEVKNRLDNLPEFTFSTDEGDILEGDLPTLEDRTNEDNLSIGQKYFYKYKEPIIVCLVTIALAIPSVNNMIGQIINKLPLSLGNNSSIVLKGILAGILYYLVKRYI